MRIRWDEDAIMKLNFLLYVSYPFHKMAKAAQGTPGNFSTLKRATLAKWNLHCGFVCDNSLLSLGPLFENLVPSEKFSELCN